MGQSPNINDQKQPNVKESDVMAFASWKAHTPLKEATTTLY